MHCVTEDGDDLALHNNLLRLEAARGALLQSTFQVKAKRFMQLVDVGPTDIRENDRDIIDRERQDLSDRQRSPPGSRPVQ
ncbi:hypothetical protein D3C76_1757580 [compost metagenome]